MTDLVKTTIFYSDVADLATLNEVYATCPTRRRRGLHQLMSAPARPTGVHRGHRRTPWLTEDNDHVKEKLERGDLFLLRLIHLAPHACRVAIRVGRLSRSG